MSESGKIMLKLGTIIKIIATKNEELHNNIFIISYLDDNIIKVESPNIENTISLNIKKGTFTDESIESIEILSFHQEEGYARQQNLLPNKWISIRFGGDLPTTINGKITNLEDDMIEVNTYPENETIYINFDYKGIPLDIPILSILEINKPPEIDHEERSVVVEEEDETFDDDHEDIEIVEQVDFIQDENVSARIDNDLIEGTKIIFLEEIGSVEEMVNVSESEKRFSLEEQRNDLMDSLLSNIPTLQRNKNVMNIFHKMVERCTELREMYSTFDKIGNITGFLVNDKTKKPIVNYLNNFEKNFKWIINIARNKKRVYNLRESKDDEDDIEIFTNDISEYKDAYTLSEYLRYVTNYKRNEVPEGQNKYYFFIEKILSLFKPHEETIKKNNVIKEGYISSEFDVLLDNLSDLESYTVTTEKKKYILNRTPYLIERYSKGLTTLILQDKFSKSFKLKPLTKNDKLSLVGLLMLPYSFIKYSKLLLHKTSIYERTKLEKIIIDYNKVFNKETVRKVINDDDTYTFDPNFLNEIKHYTIDSQIKLEDRDENYYSDFLNKIIPTNKELFNLIRFNIKNKHSYLKILEDLEPFGIYSSNIGYILYRDIVLFIEENNTKLKQKIATNIQNYSNYLYKISNISSNYGLFKIINDELGDDNSILSISNYNKHSDYNSENLNNILLLDNGIYLSNIISSLNIDLLNNIDIDSIINESMESSKSQKQNKCGDLILTKRYVASDELADDDDSDIFFDKKFDETRYEIINEFTNEQASMTPEDFNNFLVGHFQTNIGMNQTNSIREAAAIILGKKIVMDGDFAVLDQQMDDVTKNSLKYYERRNNKWHLVDEFSGRSIDSFDFCNLQDKCLKIKNACESDDDTKKYFQEKLSREIHSHFENQLEKSSEELNKEIAINLEKSKSKLDVFKKFKKIKLFSKNNFYNKISSTLEDEDDTTSPLTDLRDIILGTTDFLKKNSYIIRFVEKFCRLGDPSNEEENPYWYYCITTGYPLLPTFFYRLAMIISNNTYGSNLKNDYLLELDKIVHERGKQSDDGDCWVDKHSGYVIKNIEASNDEGYTEDGYKMVSRDVLEDEVSKTFMNQISIVDKKYKSPLSLQIKGIIEIFNTNIGIKLKSEYIILIIKNVHTQLATLKTREIYEFEAKQKAEKGKRVKTYEKYFDETLIVSIVSYYVLTVHISIPHIIEGIPFKGCSESFLGFPITSNGDFSLVDYIICVTFKIRNGSVRPWNSLMTSRKLDKMNKIKELFKEKIVRILTEYALKNDEIINLIVQKRDYLLETQIDDEITHDNLKNWDTFLPIINDFQENTVRNIAPGFETNLLTDFQNFDLNQYQKILSLQGKIRNYSLNIQKSVRKCIQKEELLLKTHRDSTIIPYLENSCCLTQNVSVFDYFVENDSTIKTNNDIVIKFEEIMNTIRKYTKAQRIISYTNTKFQYPLLPNEFSEDIIYLAYIKYLKYDSIEFTSKEVVDFSNEKGLDLTISIDKKLELSKQITELKELGVNLSLNDLLNLLNVVNRKNIVSININPQIKSSKNLFEESIDKLTKQGEFTCGDEILQLLKDITDTFEVQDSKRSSLSIENIIDQKNEELLNDITEFFETNKVERSKSKKSGNVLQFLKNFLNWDTIGEDIFYSKKDATGFKIGEILKNMIYNLMCVFPSIIVNECSYENKKCPIHWKLDPGHDLDVQKNIKKEFEEFKKYFGDIELKCFLKNITNYSNILLDFSKTIPVFMGIDEQDTILNGTIYKNLMFNLFLCGIKFYILMAGEKSRFEPDEQEEDDEDNLYISTIERQEQYEGIMGNRFKKVGNVLKTFLSVFFVNKDKILNYSNDSIKYKILKAKEKEKEKIKNRLKNLSIEEREVENYLKNNRLGEWNVGQTKSLFQYQQDRYQKEMEDIMSDLKSEMEVGMIDEVTEMRREIFGERMDEASDVYRQMSDAQEFDLSELWDDDDGNGDGDDFYN